MIPPVRMPEKACTRSSVSEKEVRKTAKVLLNAISIPFALGFGWGGDLNLEYIFEKLFSEPFGGGYPKERVVPEQRNKKILDGVRAQAFKPLAEILKSLDPELVKGALAGAKFDEMFFADAKDEELKALVKELKA